MIQIIMLVIIIILLLVILIKKINIKCTPCDSFKKRMKCPFIHGKSMENFNLRQNSDNIPCPYLNVMYNQGKLDPDSDGYLTISGSGSNSFEHAFRWTGFDDYWISVLQNQILDRAKESNGKVNLFTLSNYIDHHGSTGIRDNTITSDGVASGALVKPEKLNILKSYGDQSTQKIWARDFGKAALVQETTDVYSIGTVPHHGIEEFEYAALLQVFGRYDPGNPEPYLTFDDVEKLWIKGEFPSGWSPSSSPLRLSIVKGSATDIFNSFVNPPSCPSISYGFNVSTSDQRNQCENCGHFCTGCRLNTSGFINACEYKP
jgi:hypothetical protein